MPKLVTLFQERTFEKRPDATIALTPAVGSTVRSILPRDFIFSEDITHFSPAFDSALLDDVAFKKDFENLFDYSHLQMLHADYFGTGSSRRKGQFPCLIAMKVALPQQQKTEDISEPYSMKLALNRYMNNFKVMWSNSKRYFRLVNNVLVVLLRVHVAPERERSKRDETERDVLADENPQVAEEIFDNEDATPHVSNDVTRRRLFVLRAIVRKVVFHCTKEGVTFSEDQLKEFLNDITDQELVVCSTICRFLLPYITATVHISNVAHQLPLFLMSDDLFRITGYNKFRVKIAPLPGLNSLLSFQVDAPLLYSLFCLPSSSRKMQIYDFDNSLIENRASSLESKDGVIARSSIFARYSDYALTTDCNLLKLLLSFQV
ncbi:unnamed protein product [Mucor hiemalis]